MVLSWLTDSVTCDLDRALHYTLLWGLEAVELRSVGNRMERVPFVNEERLRRRLAECEVAISAIDPGLFDRSVGDRAGWMNELSALPETLDFCRRTGCSRVIVSGFEAGDSIDLAARALRQAGDLAAALAIRLIVFNSVGTVADSAALLKTLLETVDHEAFDAGWDPASAAASGDDAVVSTELLGKRIGYVRCTDGRRDEAGRWIPTAFGEGEIPWPIILDRLAGSGFDGPLSLDVQAEPRPREGLRAATRLRRLVDSTVSTPPT
jgi:sugar phosphate isomerase/epimerase